MSFRRVVGVVMLIRDARAIRQPPYRHWELQYLGWRRPDKFFRAVGHNDAYRERSGESFKATQHVLAFIFSKVCHVRVWQFLRYAMGYGRLLR